MRNKIVAWIVGTFSLNVLSGLGAALILKPTVNDLLQPHIRSEADGLNFVGLTVGYSLLSAGIVYVLGSTRITGSWARIGARYGIVLGFMVCLAGHLVVSGWSKLPMGAMAFSGFVDSISFMLSAMAISFVVSRGSYK